MMRVFLLLLSCFFFLSAGEYSPEELRSQIIEKITVAEDQEWADLKAVYEDKAIREVLQKLYLELIDDRSRISEKMGSEREQMKLGVVEWLGEFSQTIDTDPDLKNFFQNIYDKVTDWDSMLGNASIISFARTKSLWGSERLLDVVFLCLDKPCLEMPYHFLEGMLVEKGQDERFNEVREKFVKFQMSSLAPEIAEEAMVDDTEEAVMEQELATKDRALAIGLLIALFIASFLVWKKLKK